MGGSPRSARVVKEVEGEKFNGYLPPISQKKKVIRRVQIVR